MERAREAIVESRAHTDASLGAERASTDADAERKATRSQRVLDDLIERDRRIADEQLLRFRGDVDSLRARNRAASLEQGTPVAIERFVADEGTRTERVITDALLQQERRHVDAVVETDRREQEAQRSRLEECRQETNGQLSLERDRADVAVDALDATKDALAQAQLEQERRHDVLGMVTHDLRSPLALIMMGAHSIGELTQDAAIRESAQDVTLAAARMGRLLTDLLDVARIESGALRVVKRRHDLGGLLAGVLQWYRPLFADRAMTFTVEIPADAVVVWFDHDRIVQVLSNLLGNAMKFTPAQGTVDLHVEQRAGEIEFVLRDSGPGIHPDALPHLFERFWQIDDDTRRGLGLGLYICQKIVEAHGGRIWVESGLGQGATFRFTLPMG